MAGMKEGSVIVDVAVDQGGCVANMPALVPRTSTFALTNATLPYVLELATRGAAEAVRANAALGKGVNVWRGAVVHPGVAASLGEPATPLAEVSR